MIEFVFIAVVFTCQCIIAKYIEYILYMIRIDCRDQHRYTHFHFRAKRKRGGREF